MLAVLGLGSLLASFTLFAREFVGRVVNNLWGDLSFSGWSGPVGHQLVEGRVLFGDLMVPLPPGSFVVMSWLERAWGDGAPRLLHENWVCAIGYLLMGLFAYAIAQPLAGRRIALFTAAGTLGWVSIWIKELAYDPLAEVCAWATVALLVRVWVRPAGAAEHRLLVGAGVLTGVTLFFKQSTAVGMLGGAVVGFAYLAFAERRARGAVVARARELVAYALGASVGVGLCLAAVVALGGSLHAFLAALFVDGPALKGGGGIATRAAWALAAAPLNTFSLATFAVLIAAMVRIARHPAGFSLRDPNGTPAATERSALQPRQVAAVGGFGLVVFGGGALLLLGRPPPMAPFLVLLVSSIVLVGFAACFAVALFVGNSASAAPTRQGRAFNAAALATLVLGTTVSMSMTVFNPAYENNPIVAVCLVALFVAADRLRVRGLCWMLLALTMAMPLGWRLPRTSEAVHLVTDDSFFRNMRVNDDGLEVVKAAQRARDLAGPGGEVLVLPEDPSLAALIGRPRPALCGAIVFPDQYPGRCVGADIARLRRDPPEVLVVRPTEPGRWVPFVRTWRAGSPTEHLMVAFFRARLADYERVASYPTHWMGSTASLSIWKLRAGAAGGAETP